MTPPTDKRQAFYIDATMHTEHGFIPSVVTENEPGHTPMRGNGPHASPWYWGDDLATARHTAAKANADLGLSNSDVRDIIASSFRAPEAIAEAGQIIRSIVTGAVSYDVANGDDPGTSWILRRVTLADGTVIDHDDPTLALISSAIESCLTHVAWGWWGDRDTDGVVRIDVRTGRWRQEP